MKMKTKMFNPYQILEVNKNASYNEIKKAFRKKALIYHPDKKDTGNETKFKEIQKAWEILGDNDKRNHYDKFGTIDNRKYSQSNWTQDEFTDIFNQFFGNMGRKKYNKKYPKKGKDIYANLYVSIEELTKSFKKDVSYFREITCNDCSMKTKICSHCNGSGVINDIKKDGNVVLSFSKNCSHCLGTGKEAYEDCHKCENTGKILEKKTISINIPIGVKDLNVIRVPYMGSDGENNGPNGDLLVIIRIKDHEIFQVNNYDLLINYNISYYEAISGSVVKVPTIYGNMISVNIPQGCKNGHKIIKYGYGLPNKNKIRGHLIIKLNIYIPDNISDNNKVKLKELANYKKNRSLYKE